MERFWFRIKRREHSEICNEIAWNKRYLDNDTGGFDAYQEIRNNCGLNIYDRSIYYREYKDLNDYLCGKKLNQDKKKSRGMKM